MSSIDVILLGLLNEHPRNAYGINKAIKQRKIRSWMKVSEAAVYRNLRKLSAAGHLLTHTERAGLMPEKTVYTITEGGQAHFLALIEAAAKKPAGINFEFDTWVSHLDHLPPDKARALLTDLCAEMAAQRTEMQVLMDDFGAFLPVGARALVELRLRLYDDIEQWAEALKQSWPDTPAAKG